LENDSIMYESYLDRPFLIALHKVQDDIFGMHVCSNLFYRFNLVDKTLHYCGRMPVFDKEESKPFHSIIRFADLYFFVPFWNANLAIYDAGKDSWAKIDLSNLKGFPYQEKHDPGYFFGACLCRDQLFLLPFGCRQLLKYHVRTGKLTICADFGKTILKQDDLLFHRFAWVDEKNIILSCLCSNHVVIFNLETNEIKISTVGQEDYRFSIVIKYEDSFWLVVKNKLSFLKWNPDRGYIEEFKTFPKGCSIVNDKHCFDSANVYVHNGFLYCFPASCNMAVKFDMKNRVAEEMESLSSYCQDTGLNREQSTFDGGIREKNKIYLHYQLDKILEFDLETEDVHAYDRIAADSDSIKKWNKDHMNMFLESISPEDKEDGRRKEKSMGKRIYDTVSGFRNR